MTPPHIDDTSKVKRCCAKYLIRAGRGDGLMARIMDLPRDFLDGTLYILAINGVFDTGIGTEASAQLIFGFVIAKKIGEYSLGYIDEHIGFWKFENDYASRKINPFNHELMERIKNIENEVCMHDSPNQGTRD